ncbi:MAG: sensor histidine kinase [Bryobacteraceae bacterium]
MSTDPIAESDNRSAPEESAEELYENAPCGYVSGTLDGRIVRVNQTLLNWLGCHRSELLGKRFQDLLTVGGRILYETHFAPLLLMHGHVREIAFDLVSGRDKVVPTFVSALLKRDPTGKPILNRITIFNATERRSYERELLAARKQAEQAVSELSRVNSELSASNAALLKSNEELGQFVYAASHDLQDPLRTMTVFAQLLERRYQNGSDVETTTFVKNIVDGSRRMEALISDLLALSHAQGSDLVLKPTNLKQPLVFSLSNLSSSISESNALITYDKLPLVTIDAARIAQLFQNLISNAIKYRKTEEAPRINISATRNGQKEWLISVQDNGLGFESAYSEQIFEVFKRLHGREIPGTGIGLALCRKIVESHGGRIWATSAPGIGSRFQFTIPDKN